MSNVGTRKRAVSGRKHLTFAAAGEHYALDIGRIREITAAPVTSRVPGTVPFVVGVINLRGKILPVVDLRQRFGLSPTERTARTCVVVVELSRGERESLVGILVEDVVDVVALLPEAIAPAPSVDDHPLTPLVGGVATLEDRVLLLLDVERVLAPLQGVYA